MIAPDDEEEEEEEEKKKGVELQTGRARRGLVCLKLCLCTKKTRRDYLTFDRVWL